MNNKNHMLACLIPFLLAACGGGGGGGGGGIGFGPVIPSAPEPSTPGPGAQAPSVALTLSSTKSFVGQTVKLSWTSSDTTSCNASDAWSGQKPVTGEVGLTPDAGGRYTYTLHCSGPGGTASATARLVVPMPVLPTSYQNKNDIARDDPTIPSLFAMRDISRAPDELNFSQRSVAFADFAQAGDYDTAVTYSTSYKGVDTDGSNPGKWPDSPAKLYFLRKNEEGQWRDITASLVPDEASRYTCVTPGFVQVADLNNDGKPDVFTGCTGPDYAYPGNVWRDLSAQHVVLSQPDGTYKVVQLPIDPIYSHQASLADVDGDGNVDILSVDTSYAAGGHQRPLVMWGNGDGSFRVDYGAFPPDTQGMSIYGLVALPIDGKLTVLLSGDPPGSRAPQPNDYGTRMLQYADGSFQYVGDLTASIPNVAATGMKYGLMLDAVLSGGQLYSTRISEGYVYEAYVRTDLATGESTVLYERPSATSSGAGTAGSLKITSRNELVNQMAICDPDIQPSNYFYEVCTLRIPLQ